MTKTTKNYDEVTTAAPADLGVLPAELAAKLTEADPMESIPTFVPGKPGFEAGVTLAGYYVRTKRVYSDKFAAAKKDVNGRKYRDLHILRDVKNRNLGIWGVGQLDWAMTKLAPNQLIAITYDGQVGKPIRPGQSVPHKFTFKGLDLHFDQEAPVAEYEAAPDLG